MVKFLREAARKRGDGTEPESLFAPVKLGCGQWPSALRGVASLKQIRVYA